MAGAFPVAGSSSTVNQHFVLWSFQNSRGQWNVNPPDVCSKIETHFTSNQPSIHLLSCQLQLDFQSMTMTPVGIHIGAPSQSMKRVVLGPDSPLSRGVVWEFEGDSPGHFTVYDLDTMQALEDAHSRQDPVLDLRNSPFCQPYIIVFASMTQTRVTTGKVRNIQRRPLNQSYPVDPSAPTAAMTPVVQTGRILRKAKKRVSPYSVPTASSTAINPNTGAQFINTGVPTGSAHGSYGVGSVLGVGVMQPTHNQLPPSGYQPPGPQALPSGHQPMAWSHSGANAYPQFSGAGLVPNVTIQQLIPSNSSWMGMLGVQHINAQAPPPIQVSTSNQSSTSQGHSHSLAQTTETLPPEKVIKLAKAKSKKIKKGEDVLKSYMDKVTEGLEASDCVICCERLSEQSAYGEGQPDAKEAVCLRRCSHLFHKLCLMEMYNASGESCVQCPSCKTIYGEKTGICPSGTMSWDLHPNLRLVGHEDCGALVVSYMISPGTQGPDHPSPGKRFNCRGFPRTGFIPDCNKGRKLLKLLTVAFKRRLMFTIGSSITTGESDVVTWNEIHHKTEPHGNHHGHGYPDPNYLDNALAELAAHGVTDDCLDLSKT